MNLDRLIPAPLAADIEQRRRARILLLAITLGCIGALLVFMALATFADLARAASSLAAAALMFSAWLVLALSKSNQLAAHYFLLVIVCSLVFTYQDHAGYGVVAFIAVAVAATHLIGVRAGVFWSCASALLAVGLGAYFYTDAYDPVMSATVAAMTLVAGIASVVVETTRARAVAEAAAANADLRNERLRTRKVVKSLFPGLIDVADGTIVFAERGVQGLLGYSDTELLGQEIWDLVHLQDIPAARRWASQISPGQNIELRMRHKEGHWIWVKCYYIEGDTEDGVLRFTLACYDVSAERDSRERAVQAQRLEGVGVLAAGVAHDFNNLLTVITGFAELMDDGEARRNILSAADDAAVLVQKLMAFAKSGPLSSSGSDLVQMIDGAQPVLDSLLGAGVKLHVSLPPQPVWVRLSSSQINQVLLNLVTNAKEAMREQGHVWIDLELTQLDEATDQLEAGDYAQLTVSDDGQGMDAYSVERAFDPFYTTKSDRSGTGLGLASVYGIVRSGGGNVTLESEPDKGTSVTILLARQAARNEPAQGFETVSLLHGQGRILVVEDDELIADLIARSLVRTGYSVTIKNDVESAWRHLQNDLPDLLITDIMMPDGRGTDLARRLRTGGFADQLPILFISGYSDQEIGEWKEAGGQVKFLAKPFRAKELLDRVGQMLQHRRSA